MHITMEQFQLLLSQYESQELVRLCKIALTTPDTITVFSTPKETAKIAEHYTRFSKLLDPEEKYVKGYRLLLPTLSSVTDPFIIGAIVINRNESFNLFISTDHERLIGILGSRSTDRTYEQYDKDKEKFDNFLLS